ncbi:phosphodiester glycosidase family protein [Streptomyces sp. NBC_00572]|uniref:phosphodiester glycosidase family protein n=1 Tax=Streptomyces sp. NBC_00572 TaxID=2903664 RepID=UPI0022543DCC|nr:phosphodiester glycosidase family protein [Streptomyces sp. NBC_00572]MCX4986050.1 phosphodiester glycosidase family protein [Streptomyces sp. NBC_00572]
MAEESSGTAEHMPLGPADLQAVAEPAETLAPGVTYQKFTQGQASDLWSVELEIPYPNGKSWRVGNKTYADALVKDLAAHGFAGRVDSRELPVLTGSGSPLSGHAVRVGQFAPAEQALANQMKGWLETSGYGARTIYTAQDGSATTGPWQVQVVRVDATADVAFKAVHGQAVSTTQTVRDMAEAAGGLVAVNGSEFDIDSPSNKEFSGYDGDPEGLYVQGNNLLSEANNGRTALLLEGAGGRVRVDEITSRTQVTAPDGQVRQVDGVNRVPGRIRGCGGIGDDHRLDGKGANPEGKPWRGVMCVDDNEVVIFRPEWGTTTPPPRPEVGNSVDVVMDGNWTVKEIRPAGGPIPAGSRIMQGIGTGADWLRAHAVVGQAFKPGTTITDSQGKSVTSPTLSAVAGGGPALVRNGEVLVNTVANGMHDAVYGTPTSAITERHPRTLAGVTATGELLLVTVDGRSPGTSVGVTAHEAADVMRWLGATDALSLGIGGDTTLVANDSLYNRPMDSWTASGSTERKVGNAVVVVKK